MKIVAAFLLISSSHLYADYVTIAPPEKTTPPPLSKESVISYMIIEPQARALDYQQAFEQLRKEKTSGKVYFQLTNGNTICNIIDMTLMPNSTMILFRFNTTQGIKLQTVKVEEIVSLHYN